MADGPRRSQSDQELTRAKIRLAQIIVIVFGVLAALVLVTIPLGSVVDIFEAIAGKDTDFHFTLGIGISISVGIGIEAFGAYKLIWQGAELRRLRGRIGRLETQLRNLGQRPVR